jgi:hypothetical protein
VAKQKEEKQVNQVDYDHDVLDCGELTICVNDVCDNEHISIMAKLDIEPPNVKCKVTLRVKADTGAHGNVLPLRCMKQMYQSDCMKMLQTSGVKLRAVNGTPIQNLGYIDMPVKFDRSAVCNGRFYVCDIQGLPLLSCSLTKALGIVLVPDSKNVTIVNDANQKLSNVNCKVESKNPEIHDKTDLYNMYKDCFEGIGHFPEKYRIELKDDFVPVVSPPHKYPIQLRKEICDKLCEMEKLGVIAKVPDDSPCEWVNSLAFTRKASGELRPCLDPRDLNKAIKRSYHKIPTLEEISYKFNGSTVFSKLDAKHGYWSIELDEQSSKLCTFNSPAGKYRFCRLPFGLNVSQDIFQKYMDDIILRAGEGVLGIADDIVVFGQSVKEHNEALHRLMKTAKAYGLVFRYDKCSILQKSVSFYGLVWSQEGVKPDGKKCDSIHNCPAPKNRSELQSFLGMVQYLSPFIPHLASKTSILRQLLRHDADWDWTSEHQKSFEALKNAVHEDMSLRYFDPNKDTEIEVDASLAGLGAALVQNGKPIAFASKALTETESRYANIERELLAVVHGLEKFHTYVYGKSLIVYSGHKPLENILLKHLSKAPPRLQRMLLRIQPYDIELRYKPGKQMTYADYLSRIQPTPGKTVELEQSIHMVQISMSQLEKLRIACVNDDEMSALREQIIKGWPAEAKLVPKLIRPYWSMKDYLAVENGLVYTGQRLVIPQEYRKEYLERIHSGHQGVSKSQLRAKESVYWPNLMSDIDKSVSDCIVCLQNSKSSRKEPMLAHDTPAQPWEVLSSDLFELEGNSYILLADHYSKMMFVRGLKSTSCSEVVKFCKDLFAVHGIPKRLYSDNGPQYSAAEFRNFALTWEFEHITSSPHYPQSNGFIERMVGTVKTTLKKAKQSGTDPQMSLLCLRSTPVDSRTPSPAELLYGRKIRSNLPAKNEVRIGIQQEHDSLLEKSQIAAEYYNRTARSELPELLPGMKVLVQQPNENKWVPGSVKQKCSEPRSYVVQMPNGNEVRRNRRFLKNISPKANQQVDYNANSIPGEDMCENDESVDKSPKKTVRFNVDPDPVQVEQPRRSSCSVVKPKRLIEECA